MTKRIFTIILIGMLMTLSYCGKDVTDSETEKHPNEQPNNPNNPDDPDNPDNPDDPDNPDNPDNPDDPDNPDNPDNPDDPDNPVPENPIVPTPPDNPLPDWDPIVCETNEIWYQTNINGHIELNRNADFGANIVRHEYANGIGVIRFDGAVTKIPTSWVNTSSFVKIKGIKLPNSVQNLEPNAFKDFTRLSKIVIPDNVTEIGTSCFSGCESLTSVNIPSGVTTLRYELFSGCKSLKSVEIPANIKVIESRVFAWCSGMEKLHIPSTVETLYSTIAIACEGELFVDCDIVCTRGGEGIEYSEMFSIYGNWEGNVEYQDAFGDGVFQESYFTKVTIGRNVKRIGRKAFSGSPNIREVDIQGPVEVLKISAFNGCSSLQKIVLPDGLKEIEPRVFSGCRNIQTLHIPSSVERLWEDIATDCGGHLIVDCDILGPSEWPNVDHGQYGYYAMYYRSGNTGPFAGAAFTKITLGDNVKHIGKFAFNYNFNLTSVSFGSGVEIIGQEAFQNCPLGGEFILDGITAIKHKAFSGSKGIQKVTLKNISTIEDEAFSGCEGIKEMTINGAGHIGYGAFAWCNGIDKLTLTNIDSHDELVFVGCDNIKEVALSDIDVVTSSISGGSEKLEKATFKSIGTLEGYTYCRNLKDISLTDVKTIGSRCFAECSGLQNLTLSNIDTIGDQAFTNCTGLLTLTLDNIQTIGKQAFASCTSLESVKLLAKINITDRYVFQGCDKIEFLSLGASVTWGEWAFAEMRGLKEVLIMGRDRELIPAYSFYGCSSLNRVTMDLNEPPALGNLCFPVGPLAPRDSLLGPGFLLKVPDRDSFVSVWAFYYMGGFGLAWDCNCDIEGPHWHEYDLLFVVDKFPEDR